MPNFSQLMEKYRTSKWMRILHCIYFTLHESRYDTNSIMSLESYAGRFIIKYKPVRLVKNGQLFQKNAVKIL